MKFDIQTEVLGRWFEKKNMQEFYTYNDACSQIRQMKSGGRRLGCIREKRRIYLNLLVNDADGKKWTKTYSPKCVFETWWFSSHGIQIREKNIHPRSLTARPWKMLVGRLLYLYFPIGKVTFQGVCQLREGSRKQIRGFIWGYGDPDPRRISFLSITPRRHD